MERDKQHYHQLKARPINDALSHNSHCKPFHWQQTSLADEEHMKNIEASKFWNGVNNFGGIDS